MREPRSGRIEDAGRLDRSVSRRAYIKLPHSFGRRFTIFVDTEEEFDWGKPISRDNRATTAMKAMPDMHARMRAAGAKPVYLIDHPIATDPHSIAMLRDWMERDECTIGTQLHPWVNPPFDEDVVPFNTFTGNLPIALQRAKLEVLTETIAAAFGRCPTVYRAGRYGVGEQSADILQSAGYEIDVSVRALFNYKGWGGPSFEGIKPLPYWAGDGELLEIPLGAAFTGALRRKGDAIFQRTETMPRVRSILARTGLLARIALTPEDMPLKDVLRAMRALLDDGVQLLSISFHSPSVTPGHTPYVRTSDDLDAFHAWWDGVFDFLASNDVRPVSLEEVLAAARSTRARA